MKKVILISGSLREGSLSAILIKKTAEELEGKGFESEIIDLKNEEIPFCDARALDEYPANIKSIYEKIKKSDYVIFGMPIYCYSISGALKNFIDIFSQAFANKYFGICAATGSKLSYLASADLIRIMSFESKSIGIQPIVLADSKDFENGELKNPEILERITRMTKVLTSK